MKPTTTHIADALIDQLHFDWVNLTDIQALVDQLPDMAYQSVEGHAVAPRAAEAGHPEVFDIFINAGLDLHHPNGKMETALIMAANLGHIDIVEKMLKGAKIKNIRIDIDAQDQFGCTALMRAAGRGFGDIVQMLLDAGADYTIKSSSNMDARRIADVKGHAKVAKAIDRFTIQDHWKKLKKEFKDKASTPFAHDAATFKGQKQLVFKKPSQGKKP